MEYLNIYITIIVNEKKKVIPKNADKKCFFLFCCNFRDIVTKFNTFGMLWSKNKSYCKWITSAILLSNHCYYEHSASIYTSANILKINVGNSDWMGSWDGF